MRAIVVAPLLAAASVAAVAGIYTYHLRHAISPGVKNSFCAAAVGAASEQLSVDDLRFYVRQATVAQRFEADRRIVSDFQSLSGALREQAADEQSVADGLRDLRDLNDCEVRNSFALGGCDDEMYASTAGSAARDADQIATLRKIDSLLPALAADVKACGCSRPSLADVLSAPVLNAEIERLSTNLAAEQKTLATIDARRREQAREEAAAAAKAADKRKASYDACAAKALDPHSPVKLDDCGKP